MKLLIIPVLFSNLISVSSFAGLPEVAPAHWFFIGKIGDNGSHYKTPALRRVVHTGDRFGLYADLPVGHLPSMAQVRLTVPDRPENFPCSTCGPGERTVSPDGKTVVVNAKVDPIKGFYAFYYGISAEDPRGEHKMELLFDGELVEADSFKVE